MDPTPYPKVSFWLLEVVQDLRLIVTQRGVVRLFRHETEVTREREKERDYVYMSTCVWNRKLTFRERNTVCLCVGVGLWLCVWVTDNSLSETRNNY